ncbi:MAG: hypothetical protein K9H49_08220 [Bacteroidales bacterium]|nr:hypothetical protein [Bacteroidales bacterium]MCF8404693.1 hypothetical protein [Bacteroidales bacterium]
MKYILGLVLFLTFNIIGDKVFSQEDPLLRVELEVKSDDAKYNVLSCGENGAMLFYKTNITEDNYSFWIFVLYNKFMQESWKKDIPVYDNMHYVAQSIQDNYIYLFFFDKEKKKSDSYNYQLLKIDILSGRYELFSGLLPKDSEYASFEVLGQKLLIGLNLENDKAGLYSFDFETKETKSVFEILDNDARMEGIFPEGNSTSYLVLFNVFVSKTEYYLLIKEFGLNGEQLKTTQVTGEFGKKLNSGKISDFGGNKLLFGTYSFIKGSTIDRKNYFVNESVGFYTINLSNEGELIARYHNFLEFENMTGYLRSREYQLAQKKYEKNEDKEDKYSVTYDLLLHDVIEHDSLFYFVGEAFYEDYHTVTSTYYDYYGRAVPVSYSVFDGYRFFNAFISCYDKEGNKLWDNGMEIFNILSFDLRKRINIFFDQGDIILAYNRAGKISAKIINGPEVVEGVDNFEIETAYVNDKVMSDTKSEMSYWYDNYFLAYGFQTIRNNSLPNSKRTVFYINKVGFE